MQTEQYTVIKADEGKFLTQASVVDITERVVASSVALGKNDSATNWREISEQEADYLRKQIDEAQKLQQQKQAKLDEDNFVESE